MIDIGLPMRPESLNQTTTFTVSWVNSGTVVVAQCVTIVTLALSPTILLRTYHHLLDAKKVLTFMYEGG